jgi:hypothetical protein
LIEAQRGHLNVVLREVLSEVLTEARTSIENETGTAETVTVIMTTHFLQETGSRMVDDHRLMTKDMTVHSTAGEVCTAVSLRITELHTLSTVWYYEKYGTQHSGNWISFQWLRLALAEVSNKVSVSPFT